MPALAPRAFLLILVSLSLVGLLATSFIEGEEKIVSPAPTEASGAGKVEYESKSELPGERPAAGSLVAGAAYLINDNRPLYSFYDQKQWPIASLTKLMSSLTARRLLRAEEIITMTEAAVAAPGEAGNFKTGERFRAENLVRAMLIASSNDASYALASHYGSDTFVAEMNRLAADIGMSNTVFVDSAGLSARNLSTPEDLSKLVRFIWLNDPEIFTISRARETSIVDIDKGQSRKLYNTNLFAGRDNFLGGKTGQIPDAGGNLISIFDLPDKSSPVIIIVLGAQDRFKETEKILTEL